VECLVIDNLEDYPLILGNPWLNLHYADISYQRKQVILRKRGPHGQHYIINTFISPAEGVMVKALGLHAVGREFDSRQ
jgi:hypothetical protein